MEHKSINLKLKIWRQSNSQTSGSFKTYTVNDVSTEGQRSARGPERCWLPT